MKKYDHVDALRGIAVLLVILVHTGKFISPELFLNSMAKFGQYGVQLFFVMSAFTLCNSINKTVDFRTVNYVSFMTRRFFRIAPLYYIAIPVYFIFTYSFLKISGDTPFTPPNEYSPIKILSNIIFVHGMYPAGNNNMVPGGWSIGCEFLFYAMFPFLFYFIKAKRMFFLYITLVSGACLSVLIILKHRADGNMHWEIINNTYIYFSVFNQMPCFLLGIAYYFYAGEKSFRNTIFSLSFPALLLLIYLHNSQWGSALTPLLAGVLSVTAALILGGMNISPFIKRVGEISFSMYIWHFIPAWILGTVIQKQYPELFQNGFFAIVYYLVVFGITYLVSSISSKLIEIPFNNFGHKLSAKIQNFKSSSKSLDEPLKTTDEKITS